MVRLRLILSAFVLVTVLFNLCTCREEPLPCRHQQYDLAPLPQNCNCRNAIPHQLQSLPQHSQPSNITVEHPRPIDGKNKCPQLPFSKYIFKNIPANTKTVVHKSSDIIFQNGPTHIVINHPDLIIQPAPVLFHTPAAVVSGCKPIFRNPAPKHIENQHLAYPKNNAFSRSRLFNNVESSVKPTHNFPAKPNVQINRLNNRDNDERYNSGSEEEQNQPILHQPNFQQHYGLQNKFAQQRHQQEDTIACNRDHKLQREQNQRAVYYQSEVEEEDEEEEDEIENEEDESEVIEIRESGENEFEFDTERQRAGNNQIEQIPEKPVQQQKSFAAERHFNPRYHHRSMQ